MSKFYVIETATRAAGLAVLVESGLQFHASDNAFAALEKRRYARLEDIRADVERLAASTTAPVIAAGNHGRRGHKRSTTR
jgi:hypothetical protein